RLGCVDVAALSAQQRADRLGRLRRAIDALEAQFTATVAHSDAAGDGELLDGARSTSSWLRDRLHLASGDAAERVRLARQAHHGGAVLSSATRALAQGGITFGQLRAIGHGICDLDPEPARRAVELLLELSSVTDAGKVRAGAHYLRDVVDPERGRRSHERSHEARRASLAATLDGMYRLDLLTDAEGGAVLDAAVSALMAPSSAEDPRTAAQRRHDAVLRIMHVALEHEGVPVSGGMRPQIVVTCTPEALAGEPGAPPATWFDGRPVPAPVLGRLACDGAVTRVVFGADGHLLDLGRTQRFFSSAQRRALWIRDRGCRFPGCAAPWAEAHHVRHWTDGGPSDLVNAVLLCGRHHACVHERGWRIVPADPLVGSHGVVDFLGPRGQRRPSTPPHTPAVYVRGQEPP
ncbi:MAG: DUF222 domain-containing protein, partial [Actinomycetes bacterium]